MLLTQQDIYIRDGSTESFGVTVTDAAGAAVDCTGVALRMQIRDGAAGRLHRSPAGGHGVKRWRNHLSCKSSAHAVPRG